MLSKIKEEVDSFFARDPAARSRLEIYLAYPGFHAVILHRLAHRIWEKKYHTVARVLSYVSRMITGIEIHPGATLGKNLFIDHGMGIVIGETARIGEGVTIYHDVTLGGVAPQDDKKGAIRHPQIGDNVIIGSGAQLLGPIKVGEGAKIGSNAVVVTDVEPGAIMVGIPARKMVKKTVVETSAIFTPSEPFTPYASATHGEIDSRQLTIETLLREVNSLKERVADIEAQTKGAEKTAESWKK